MLSELSCAWTSLSSSRLLTWSRHLCGPLSAWLSVVCCGPDRMSGGGEGRALPLVTSCHWPLSSSLTLGDPAMILIVQLRDGGR